MRQILIVIAFVLTACSDKKDAGITPDGQGGDPVITEAGTPDGPLAEKQIGPAGGDLISNDGTVTITVPAGAVTAPVTFSIQPITNTVRGNAKAYRLQPEGKLAAPVTLTFRYTEADLEGTAEDYLLVSYRQANGTWKAAPTALNKTNKTLTVTTDHFSDWTVNGGFNLHISKTALREGEETKLTVEAYTDDEGLLAPLVPSAGLTGLTSIGNWRILEGAGSLLSDVLPQYPALHYKATYKAPDPYTGSPAVVICVDVQGFNKIKDPSVPGGVRSTGKLILFAHLIVTGGEYMAGSVGGTNIAYTNVVAVTDNASTSIAGNSDNLADPAITVYFKGAGTGAYPCGDILIPGKAMVIVAREAAGSTSEWTECNPPYTTHYSSGQVAITKWGAPGEFVEGHFSGTLYKPLQGCEYTTETLNITFRALREQ